MTRLSWPRQQRLTLLRNKSKCNRKDSKRKLLQKLLWMLNYSNKMRTIHIWRNIAAMITII